MLDAQRRLLLVFDMLAVTLASEEMEVSPQRALWWPAQRTLFVADVHLGKAGTLRARGLPLSGGLCVEIARRDLRTLSSLIARCDARALVILGDLLHAPEARHPELLAEVADWRTAHTPGALDITLVRGNHDTRAGDPPAAWAVRCVDEGEPLGPFTLVHDPHGPAAREARGYALGGHIHPVVVMEDVRGRTERSPCFWFGARTGVLPAFGSFTGGARVSPAPGDQVLAVGEGAVVPVPVVPAVHVHESRGRRAAAR